jgi:hypothetical protein
VAQLHDFDWDERWIVSSMDPPQHIAPFAAAIDADIRRDGDLASGRLILLHDPAGNDIWHGDFRCVTFCQADVSAEMAHDPFLPEVGWSWLMDSLTSRQAQFVAESGTITTTASTPFGSRQADPATAQIEMRASWTPLLQAGNGLTDHIAAWQDLISAVAGLPPLSNTVIHLSDRLGRRV